MSYRHRYALFKVLEKSLIDVDYDFSAIFKNDHDEYDSTAWDETEITDPREFFEDIYRLAAIEWKHDLEKASLEDQSTW